MSLVKLKMRINGEAEELDVQAHHTLMDVVRDQLQLTGAKTGCNMGECGACTMIVDGHSINSCLMLAIEADGKDVLTIEGLANGTELHPLQTAFAECHGTQCGYCTPGMIMAAKALLDENPHPTLEEVRFGLAGNICRCTGYEKIFDSLAQASRELATGSK